MSYQGKLWKHHAQIKDWLKTDLIRLKDCLNEEHITAEYSHLMENIIADWEELQICEEEINDA